MSKREYATFAGGCFWCTEALFKRLKGVVSVTSGYSGGAVVNPSYEAVCTGRTGHAEAIQIVFDPEQISYEVLLQIFFHTHNPTTLNQQGADIGTQYRSAIFYHDEDQKRAAEKVITDVTKENVYNAPIVTEVVPFAQFYPAENYHENYYERNRSNPYCTFVIDPKLSKLLKEFRNQVKDEYVE